MLEGTNRGLQCLFGDLPAVHAYMIRLDGAKPTTPLLPGAASPADDKSAGGTALICESPRLPPEAIASYIPGENKRALLPGAPFSVCLEVTLNGNRTQGTDNCVEFTYYDQ